MRAIWKGAVAFGLVHVPVRLYAATGEQNVPLHQVHAADGGRIHYRKVCSVDGAEVPYAEIAKGYETGDGRTVVLTDEDLASLPIATEREIAVEEFVPADQVDPIMLAKTYYLEPDATAAKPYALLREALRSTDRMAVVKVALRQRESMAVLRVRGDVICLQTLLWPDEVRAAEFPVLENDVTLRPQELAMASSLVESLAADFDPSDFEDAYKAGLERVIEAKVSTGKTITPAAGAADADEGGEVIDLLAALQRSVEKARRARGEIAAQDTAGEAAPSEEAASEEPASDVAPKRGRASSSKPATKPAAAKADGATTSASTALAAKASARKAAAPRTRGTKATPETTASSGTKPTKAKTSTSKAATSKAATSKAATSKAATSKAPTSKPATTKDAGAAKGASRAKGTAADEGAATATTGRRRAS